MSTWICLYSLIKGFEYERVIVAFTNDIRHNTPIIKVQNGTEIDLGACEEKSVIRILL